MRTAEFHRLARRPRPRGAVSYRATCHAIDVKRVRSSRGLIVNECHVMPLIVVHTDRRIKVRSAAVRLQEQLAGISHVKSGIHQPDDDALTADATVPQHRGFAAPACHLPRLHPKHDCSGCGIQVRMRSDDHLRVARLIELQSPAPQDRRSLRIRRGRHENGRVARVCNRLGSAGGVRNEIRRIIRIQPQLQVCRAYDGRRSRAPYTRRPGSPRSIVERLRTTTPRRPEQVASIRHRRHQSLHGRGRRHQCSRVHRSSVRNIRHLLRVI